MQHITDNELAVLRAILTNYFHDGLKGRETIGNLVWADCINDAGKPSGVTGKSLSGVVSSLSRKGLIVAEGGKDACVCLTTVGYEAAIGG